METTIQHYSDTAYKYILCIDDERTILEALYAQLIEKFEPEYEVECAESGQEALDLFTEIYAEDGRVDLVICDQLMPGLLGQHVLEQMHQRDRRMMKILLTGQAGLDAVTYAINHAGLHKYIEKPWDKYDLLMTAENLLKQRQMSGELDFSRRRYERILQSMNNGVISLNFQGIITSFNHAASAMLGFKPEAVLGKAYADVFLHNSGNEQINETILRATRDSSPHEYQEVEFSRKDGSRIPLGLLLSNLTDYDHKTLGTLIVFHDLSEIRKYSALKNMFSRYVSKQVVDKLITSEDLALHGEKREVSILFADIRGFTRLSAQLEPTDVVTTLNAYFSCMIDVIHQYDGMLDKFLGDGIMCIFGAPIEQPDHAERAARTALEMQHALIDFNKRQQQAGNPTLEIGIGINTGDAVVGNVGSEKRLEYTAIGDNVNLASRLQGIAGGGQIIISESTYAAIQAAATVKELEPVHVKGKMNPIHIYELQGTTGHEDAAAS